MLGLDQDLIVGYRGVPGNVLQVVNATYSTATSSSTNVYADTGLTATITPTSASSKILVITHHSTCAKTPAADTSLNIRLLRGASVLAVIEQGAGYTQSASIIFIGTISSCYLDSPATTSTTTYKTQFASGQNVGSVFVHQNNTVSTITLMEIAA